LLRALALAAAILASTASSQAPPRRTAPPGVVDNPPAPRAMEPNLAIGLYRTSFGPVKIEFDDDVGLDQLMGVWVYDREGQEIVGFFSGKLRGNVLEFTWQEPGLPEPLTGAGFLVFHEDGSGFAGKWWTHNRDRTGDWTGHKHRPRIEPEYADPGTGGQRYGGVL
jgi:hypothetical protein